MYKFVNFCNLMKQTGKDTELGEKVNFWLY